MTKAQETKDSILECAKQEFLKEGFAAASMRSIAQRAGLTTGAIYRYYADKETLFHAIVSPAADMLYDRFVAMQEEFAGHPAADQADAILNHTGAGPLPLLRIVYENRDVFKLIVCHADGTEYAGYIDKLVDVEERNTRRFLSALKKEGIRVSGVSASLNHILASAYFKAVFETVAHDMPQDEAVAYVEELTKFYRAGWNSLLGL